MKKYLIIILFLIFPILAFPDEFRIPFSCWPKEIQAEFAKFDLKLDLSGNERNDKSWGFLINEGSSFKIYTYKPTTKEERAIIRKVVSNVQISGK